MLLLLLLHVPSFFPFPTPACLSPVATGNVPARIPLRRGKSILAREEDEVRESGLSLFKRGGTLRRKPADDDDAPARAGLVARQGSTAARKQAELDKAPEDRGFWGGIAPGPVDGWMIYCFLITCWVPIFIMKYVFGGCRFLSRLLAPRDYPLTLLLVPRRFPLLRQAHPRGTACVAREDWSPHHHPLVHGRRRFHHLRLHSDRLWHSRKPVQGWLDRERVSHHQRSLVRLQ